MVTINTTDDLLRALSEKPSWKEAVRREILTEELLKLPARFERFVATTEAFMAEQRQINANATGFIAEQRQINANTAEFIADQRQTNAEQRQFNANTTEFIAEQRQINAEQKEFNARMERRTERMQRDIGILRGDYARRRTLNEAEDIALDMGFRLLQTLTQSDLRAMHQAGDAAGISSDELRSFRRADLVIAVADGDAATHYIAMEVSYTADDRDTGRALRNAGFITRFTGCPAHAAIASVRNDDRIQPLIDSGQIHWHQLEDRDYPIE